MKKLQTIVPVILGAAALAVGLVVFLNDTAEPAPPVVYTVKPATASLDTERAYRVPVETRITASMLSDVVTSSHILRATVTAAEQSNNSTITVTPLTYLKGSVLTGPLVIKTHTNASFSDLIGKNVVVGINHREVDDAWVLSHTILSLTAPRIERADNLEVSEAFYSDMLAIYDDYKEDVDSAMAQPMVNNAHPLPAGYVAAVKERLLHYFTESGTSAAEAASIELYGNAHFQRTLTEAELDFVAAAVRNSQPRSVDRGHGFMLLRSQQAKKLSYEDIANLIRDEDRLLILDHMGTMLYESGYDEVETTNFLASIYTNVFEETDQARLNAVALAGQFGSRLAIPELNKLLGRETWLPMQRELLNVYRYLADEAALPALVRYLNGGLGDEGSDAIVGFGTQMPAPVVRVQNDCLANIELHQRTLLAIATIDSENSNAFIRHAISAAKDPFMVDFLEFLTPKNKDWRNIVDIVRRDPISFEEVRARAAANN